MPEPGYNSYLGGTLLSDAVPYKYPLRPEDNFLIDLDKIPADVMKKAKILYLNYPNNPTSAIAPREYLEDVVRRCKELDILLVYDNAYSELAYDGYVPPSIFEIEGARDVAIEFHSMSKTYNMTGWRCGWACGKQEFVGALAKVKSFVDTGTFMGIQAAAATALDKCADWIPTNVAEFKRRRDAAVEAFNEAGFPTASPEGDDVSVVPAAQEHSERRFRRASSPGRRRDRAARLAVRSGRRRILPRLVHRLA